MLIKYEFKELLSRYFPILIWGIIIFSLSADPEPYNLLPKKLANPISSEIRMENIRAEKIGNFLHVVEYSIFSYLVSRGIVWKRKISWQLILLSIIYSVLFAISDEVHQIFIPNRAFEYFDLQRDFFGILIGIGVYLLFRTLRKRHLSESNRTSVS